MRTRFIYHSKLLRAINWVINLFITFKINGIVLYPFVLFRDRQPDVTPLLWQHEVVHIYQIKDVGFFRFYFTYIKYWIQYGYYMNPYEVDARVTAAKMLGLEEDKNV